jgi:ABC-type protease/lipase transport system fused ATPase/permease subunit
MSPGTSADSGPATGFLREPQLLILGEPGERLDALTEAAASRN